jgi:serine/threonine protein kinase
VQERDPQQASGVTEGQVLAGKYRVERVLGIGGMGVVVAAHHLHLDQRVAIKFLLPEMLDSPDAVALFAREARAAVRIKGEHVARVFDVGTLETGAPYMIMEYLEGSDLSMWVRRGALPIEQAIEFVIQACVAIAEAHALGIVHRDIKPSNLFCVRGTDGRPTIKVLDFGISKVTTFSVAVSALATKTSAIMGSPLYMSPEQMRSAKAVDARTDIWALGIVLYELLTGRVPFASEMVADVIIRIATQVPEPMRTFRPGLPEGLEGVFRKCTEKDRERRYGNVGELAIALLPFAPRSSKPSVEKIAGIIQSAGLSSSALAVPPSPAAPSPTETALGSTARAPLRGHARTIAALSAAIAVIVAVTAGWRVSRRQGSGVSAPVVAAALASSSSIPIATPVPATATALAVTAPTGTWIPIPPPATTTSTSTPTATPTPTHHPPAHPPVPALPPASDAALAPPPHPPPSARPAPPLDPLQALTAHP